MRHVHERWDGAGYPGHLRGEEIPYLARILAVADTYAAITMDRPYRPGAPGHQAYHELLAAAGTQLDPELVQAFRDVVVGKALPTVGAETAPSFDQVAAS